MSASSFQDYVTECVYDCFNRYVPEGRLYRFKYGRVETFAVEFPNMKIPRKQFCGYGGRKRVDIYAEYRMYEGELLSYCFECKSSKQDLQSGYGLNFFADMNYIIVPKKVYGWDDPVTDAIKYVANNIGVITVDCDSGLLHTIRPCWIMPTYPDILTEAFGG